MPGRAVTDEQLAPFASGSGLNAPYVADLFSAFLPHERDGVALYSALEAMTNNPALRGKYGSGTVALLSPEKAALRNIAAAASWSDLSAMHTADPPGQALDAGDAQDRALGGVMSELRWEHATCNRRAGGKLAQVSAKTRRLGGRGEAHPSRRW